MSTQKYNFNKELQFAEQIGDVFSSKEKPTYEELDKFTDELIKQYNSSHCFNRLFKFIMEDENLTNDKKIETLKKVFKSYKKSFYVESAKKSKA